jgi:endonuclease YncB( thermonuclease family)
MVKNLDVPYFSSAAYTATIDHVVDGDTVHLKENIQGTNKVRLLSIDTPETNFLGKSQEPWGTSAKNYLHELLPPGTRVTIETDVEKTDHYGRLLAHIYKGSLDVNKEMVRQGQAVTYFIWPNMLNFKNFQLAYLEAKQNGRGIWNPSNPLPELPFEFRDRISGESQDKYVGDFFTKKYVAPNDYKKISIENRVFFFTESDARSAGYTKEGSTNDGVISSDLEMNEVIPTTGTNSKKRL